MKSQAVKDKLIIYAIVVSIILVLLIPVTYNTLSAIFLPKSPGITILGNLEMYMWTAIGVVSSFIIFKYFNKNLEFLTTLSHEATHAVVALMLLRKVHSLHAEENQGVIHSSGSSYNHIPVALAPYCLPIVSYPLLFLRCIIATEMLWVYDIILGITLGFHLYCFYKQTHNYQIDINQYPYWFSYLYIWTARLLNINVFLLAFWSSLNGFLAFVHIGTGMWGFVKGIFECFI